jgi:hypothetical protein
MRSNKFLIIQNRMANVGQGFSARGGSAFGGSLALSEEKLASGEKGKELGRVLFREYETSEKLQKRGGGSKYCHSKHIWSPRRPRTMKTLSSRSRKATSNNKIFFVRFYGVFHQSQYFKKLIIICNFGGRRECKRGAGKYDLVNRKKKSINFLNKLN